MAENNITEQDFIYLHNYYKHNNNTVTVEVQQRMVEIYERAFKEKISCTPCSFKSKVHNKLNDIYEQYKSDKEQE